ncbi:MAG TPA: amino acid ABC transporter substrate-binding protein [Clostridium sp.]|jgi:polar amino acid transport system substrate-binding protein|uniref:ABC transporter substrate-binding protein n=1 Tax=Clostridium lapidicellarium TaxID=3240931 RepID=A0ABV4DYT8_9CLOT|nr:amino acid ABC transporter substrate-binding protein [Clostridiales bacterium]HBC95819.1 amino acid ABC transporter substrate-binding protein [Clostridium sp.]
MKKFKKIITIGLSVICTAVLLAGCGGSGNTSQNGQGSQDTLEKVKKSGVLKVGLEDSFPPMEFRDSQNKLQGFDIDMANAIAKKMGVKAQFISTEFNGIVLALKSGKFDTIISGMSITDDRKKQIDFSKPYVENYQIIVTKSGNSSVKSSKDLDGKRVGVGLGTTSEQVVKKFKNIKEVKKYDKTTEELQDLLIGRLDAVVVDEPVGKYYISKSNKKSQYNVLSEKLSKEPMGIGFKKGDKKLEAEVQKTFDELKKDGTMSKISTKWFGEDIYK